MTVALEEGLLLEQIVKHCFVLSTKHITGTGVGNGFYL